MKTIELQAWRRWKYLSQRELAKKAGISRSAIARTEAGLTEPTLRTQRALAAALGVKNPRKLETLPKNP